MYRADGQHNRDTINYILNISSIGDSICTIPALRYLTSNFESDFKIWMGKEKIPLYEQFIPKKYIYFSENHFTEVDRSKMTKTASLSAPINNANGNLVEFFNWSILNKNIPQELWYYPKWEDPGIDLSKHGDIDWEKAIILPVNFIWLSRAILSTEWNKLVDYIVEKGYLPVFVGKEAKHEHARLGNYQIVKTPKNIDFSKGVDLRDKTNLKELLAILSKAKAVVGADSGILHLAALTNVEVIGAYTAVDPEIRIPWRLNEEGTAERGWRFQTVVPEVPCRFCASHMIVEQGHDFIGCLYDDFQCMKEITAEKLIEKLENVL